MKKILLIEDNENILANTAEILELANYKIFTANNGKSGVEVALKESPDLIICDIMMPVLDGYGVLHLLHKNPSTRNIPFIFLTAKTERSDFRKGMELGADDYITKPFSGTELLNAIEGRLKRSELLKEDLGTGLEGLDELMKSTASFESIEDFTSGRNTNKYRKKQVIFSEGNRPSVLYYIQKGKVKTYKTNEEGKELVMGLYNEGEFLGHIALLENNNYKETAEAMEETDLALIPKEDFEKLINNNKEISRKFIQLLAKNISEKEDQLLALAYNSLRKKVAETLILLSKKYKKTESTDFSIEISRENLAAIAGTATESVIRTLSDFRNEKLIEVKGSSIIILNQKKLEHMMN